MRLVLLATTVALLGQLCLSAELSFKEWKEEYGEAAFFANNNANGLVDREKVYYENVRRIQRLNEENNGATFAVNQYAAMTPEEFKQHVLMPPRKPVRFPEERYVKDKGFDFDIPDAFDWRNHTPSVVTSVKNQGSGGTCWAFSTIGNVEGQFSLQTKEPAISLSVEQLVDCDSEKDPDSLHSDCSVFGGWPYLAYQYIEKAGGVETDEDYPYCSNGTGTCFPCMPPGYNATRCGYKPPYCVKNQSCSYVIDPSKFVKGLKVKGWTAFGHDETALAGHLIQTGPLSVLMNAELLVFYHSGVWHPHSCKSAYDDLDHAILLVGYGVEKGLLETKPYWTIKNSWGEKWGDKGYFKLARGVGACGINVQPTTAILAQ